MTGVEERVRPGAGLVNTGEQELGTGGWSCYTFNEPWPGCSVAGRGNTVTGYYRSFNSDVISDLLGHHFEDEQAGPEVQAEFLPKQVL